MVVPELVRVAPSKYRKSLPATLRVPVLFQTLVLPGVLRARRLEAAGLPSLTVVTPLVVSVPAPMRVEEAVTFSAPETSVGPAPPNCPPLMVTVFSVPPRPLSARSAPEPTDKVPCRLEAEAVPETVSVAFVMVRLLFGPVVRDAIDLLPPDSVTLTVPTLMYTASPACGSASVFQLRALVQEKSPASPSQHTPAQASARFIR